MTTTPNDREPPASDPGAGAVSGTDAGTGTDTAAGPGTGRGSGVGTGAGQLSVGVLGSTDDELARGLEAQSPDLDVCRLDAVPEDVSVLSYDCFVVDGLADTDHHQRYDRIREHHASVPVVVVSTGANPAVAAKLRSDEDAVRVGPTEDGLPYALLSARCKGLADHAVVGAGSEESEPAYSVRAAEFYALWGVAALTYGAGDLLSTRAALLTVPGLVEQNPVVATVLQEVGVVGFVGLKTLVFLVAIGISASGASTDDRLSYYGPPLFVSAVGTALTVWNLSLLL
jgi:hypothetical protein